MCIEERINEMTLSLSSFIFLIETIQKKFYGLKVND